MRSNIVNGEYCKKIDNLLKFMYLIHIPRHMAYELGLWVFD